MVEVTARGVEGIDMRMTLKKGGQSVIVVTISEYIEGEWTRSITMGIDVKDWDLLHDISIALLAS